MIGGAKASFGWVWLQSGWVFMPKQQPWVQFAPELHFKEWTHQKHISQTHVFAITIRLFQSLASDVSGGGKWNHVTALGRWISMTYKPQRDIIGLGSWEDRKSMRRYVLRHSYSKNVMFELVHVDCFCLTICGCCNGLKNTHYFVSL